MASMILEKPASVSLLRLDFEELLEALLESLGSLLEDSFEVPGLER